MTSVSRRQLRAFSGDLNTSVLVTMLACVLSRRFCQVAADLNRSSLLLRTFATSNAKNSEKPNNDSVVTYEQLKSMLSNHNIQLFDVRNPDEFQAGCIPEAVNIPLDNLEESLKLSPEHFKMIFEVRAPGKNDDNIVFHCQRGNRSLKALDIAHRQGFSRARHYKGGYSEWAEREGK
ncbi:thiosulfate:glutathione sulfurtransferase [Myripristis murdjan]|uniref:Thiosulfate:glutathione sulfurtransferase-like n=1 Tax=Myripristis murdjan TaxID=586833 RepID=A0A667X0K3_9TELE|nr:thiosulfate:glutathione sulfurtransferase-like [Myripristis murdjan]